MIDSSSAFYFAPSQRWLPDITLFASTGFILLNLLISANSLAQPTHYDDKRWDPYSSTAMGVTGIITLSSDRIDFQNKQVLPILIADEDRARGVTLFKILNGSNPPLLNDAHLCGNLHPDYLLVESKNMNQEIDISVILYPSRQLSLEVYKESKRGANPVVTCASYIYSDNLDRAKSTSPTGSSSDSSSNAFDNDGKKISPPALFADENPLAPLSLSPLDSKTEPEQPLNVPTFRF